MEDKDPKKEEPELRLAMVIVVEVGIATLAVTVSRERRDSTWGWHLESHWDIILPFITEVYP